MADIIPATGASRSMLTPLTEGGSVLTRLSGFTAQPAVRKMLPAFLGLAAVGGAALTWSMMAPSPQRVLYAQLDDTDRAGVTAALGQAGIKYEIDNQTGALTVGEDDFYKARMLVAQNNALAAPETGDQLLDKLPMGASRNLEGERLRSARERDLELTIGQIDGVESVRVHLAEAEKSVFVRDDTPPTASVMLRLKSGRQISDSQVAAIVNLVAGSIPGLSPDAVKVIDQHGTLLSQGKSADSDRLDMQSRMEAKLRDQVSQLLTPMLGDGKFTSEIQVDLDMSDVTSARESYDKDGVVKSETQAQSQSGGAAGQGAVGVPGVLSNTPPPPTTAVPGAPQGTAPAAAGAAGPTSGESSSTKNYELGREVSVTNSTPGGIKRLTVAVAISKEAIKTANAKDMADMEQLVSAAVGANPQRGDVVKVVMRNFEPAMTVAVPFYEAPWFAMLVRNGAAVLAVLLVLLLGVRPALKAVRGDAKGGKKGKAAAGDMDDAGQAGLEAPALATPAYRPQIPGTDGVDVEISRADLLNRQMGLAQRLVAEKPGSALEVVRQMLNEPAQKAA